MFTINLDMDNVVVDLFEKEDWLIKLRAEDVSPYVEAKPCVNLSQLARLLNQVQRMGYKIAIISWTSKDSSLEYHKAVQKAKEEWLAKHLKSVNFDFIHIVEYGVPKESFCNSPDDILIDDTPENRLSWTGIAYPETAIFDVLKRLARGE